MQRKCPARPWQLAVLVVALAGPPAQAASLYRIDQRFGNIGFTVNTMGLFDTEGRFPRFQGELLLDADQPEHSRIDVTIDASAIEMPLQDQTDLLRSPAYFDTQQHPANRFVSTAIQTVSPAHYAIHGTLQVRGVTQPQDLDAVVQDRHVDPATKAEVVDFVVTGQMRRSAFGMVADQTMISDMVRLKIRIVLAVKPGTDGG
jgi:polyisoprenoid-binding protein YceI